MPDGKKQGADVQFLQQMVPSAVEDGTWLARPEGLVLFRLPKPLGQLRSVYALANPDGFSEEMEPQYSKRPVLGLSQEIVQYIRTASRTISMDLWVSWELFVAKGWVESAIAPLLYRNFFMALTVPASVRKAPPQVEVRWPMANLNFVGVVTSLRVQYERFSHMGDPLDYMLSVSFVEVANRLMTSPRVLVAGPGYKAFTST